MHVSTADTCSLGGVLLIDSNIGLSAAIGPTVSK